MSEKKGAKGTMRIGEALVEAGLINNEQLDAALDIQKKANRRIGEVLVDLGFVTESQIIHTLEYLYHIPYIDLSTRTIERSVIALVSEGLAQKHGIIPVELENGVLSIAMADPLDFYAIDDAQIVTGYVLKIFMSTRAEIDVAINRYYGREGAEKAVEDLQKEFSLTELSSLADLSESEVASAPVVRLVNSMISHAVKANASDIHIEPTKNELRVRFRIDGDLTEVMHSSMSAHSAIVTRIKIIGQMDIAEKRIPQDGRVEVTIDGKEIDLRLSILPTVYGEKVVLRILGSQTEAKNVEELGFTEENLEMFKKIISSPNGVILVSGPTGSGKTTTLYTVLKELNKPNVNIITVEDPVEYKMDGITQVQVNPKANLTFAAGLRSILRQDPDIILIGEIRDSETAEIAIRAAITGHLVLSTIHTNDAASSVARLVDMGIEPFLVSSAVVGIIAQRLVKCICPRCKTEYRPDHNEMMQLKLKEIQPLYKGAGCPACNFSGYQKRVAIHEVLVVTKEIRDLIDRRASIDQIKQMISRYGTTSLRDNCRQLVLDGITTTAELARVTYSIEG